MKLHLPFIAASLLFTSLSMQAADLSAVEQTVAKARQHLGGEQALQSVHSLQYRGTVTLQQGKDEAGNEREPLVGKAILSFDKPFSQRVEFVFEDQSLVTGFNGFEAYEYVEFQQEVGDPLRNTRSIGGDELRRNKAAAIENLMFFRPFPFDSNNVKDHGIKTEGGKQVHHIDFIHGGRFIFSRYFDTATGDLVKTVLDTGMVTVETGDLMASGIRFSTDTVGELDGEVRYRIRFEEVVVNPEFPNDYFDYPM
jgi:hypothetical protein